MWWFGVLFLNNKYHMLDRYYSALSWNAACLFRHALIVVNITSSPLSRWLWFLFLQRLVSGWLTTLHHGSIFLASSIYGTLFDKTHPTEKKGDYLVEFFSSPGDFCAAHTLTIFSCTLSGSKRPWYGWSINISSVTIGNWSRGSFLNSYTPYSLCSKIS